MVPVHHDIDDDRTQRTRHARRGVLLSLGTAVTLGLAGCSGDDNTSDGGPENGGDTPASTSGGESGVNGGGTNVDTSNGGDTQAPSDGTEPGSSGGGGAATCADLTAGFTTFDPGERPHTFRCERPEVLSALTYTSPPGFNVRMRPQNASEAEYPKLLRITQTALHRGQSETPYEAEAGDGVSTVEFEFGGETLGAAISEAEGNTAGATTALPYEFERGKRYVTTNVYMRVFLEGDGSIGDECGPNMNETVRHVFETLEPNPQTTIQSATDQYN